MGLNEYGMLAVNRFSIQKTVPGGTCATELYLYIENFSTLAQGRSAMMLVLEKVLSDQL